MPRSTVRKAHIGHSIRTSPRTVTKPRTPTASPLARMPEPAHRRDMAAAPRISAATSIPIAVVQRRDNHDAADSDYALFWSKITKL